MKSNKNIWKAIELKFAYIFCGFRILIDLTVGVIGTIIFVHTFQTAINTEVRVVMIGAFVVGALIVGADIHNIVMRDLRHIRSTDPNKKQGFPGETQDSAGDAQDSAGKARDSANKDQDIAKKNKIEY